MMSGSTDAHRARESSDIDETEDVDSTSKPIDLTITIRDTEAYELVFQLKSTTEVGKAMKIFATRKGMEVKDLRFLFDGQRVNVRDTPDSLEMEDGDVIDVHFEVIGGGDDIE